MGQLGAKLKKARLDQGLSLEELRDRTKIQTHYLEGIETGNYSVIPGTFYMRAFVKRYAQAVGLDGETLLAEHNGELPQDAPAEAPTGRLSSRKEKKTRSAGPATDAMPKVLVALFIVFIILVIYYFYLLSTSGSGVEPESGSEGVEYEAPASQPPAQQQQQPEEPQQEEQDEPAALVDELSLEGSSGETTTYRFTGSANKQLTFNAAGESWLSIKNAQGTELMTPARLVQAGESETIDVSDERSITIRVGNYTVLDVEVNGQPVSYDLQRKPQNIAIQFDGDE